MPTDPLQPEIKATQEITKAVGALSKTVPKLKEFGADMALLNTAFLKMTDNLGKTGRSLDALVKKFTQVQDGVKKIKKANEKTWTDLIEDKVVKQFGKQLQAIDDLSVGTANFTERLKKLKQVSGAGDSFEVMSKDDSKKQFDMLSAMERRIKQFKAAVSSINGTKAGIDIGAGATLKELVQAENQLKAIRLQSVLAGKAMQEGFEGVDLDPIADEIAKLSGVTKESFVKAWKDADQAAKDHFKKLQEYQKVVVTSPSPSLQIPGAADRASVVLNEKDSEGNATEAAKKMRKALEAEGATIAVRFVAPEGSTDAFKDELKEVNDYVEAGGVELEKNLAIQAHLADAAAKQIKFEETKAELYGKESKLSREVLDAQLKLSKLKPSNVMMGFLDGGLKGGMSAFAQSMTSNKKKILASEIPMEEKAKLLEKHGYKTEMKDGNLTYQAKGFNDIAQRLEGAIKNGFKGAMKKDAGVLTPGAEGAEAVEGMEGAAEGAEVALGGLEVAFAAAASAIMIFVAIFKAYSAVVDHAAKNYKEVRSLGGLSAMGAGKTGVLDLHKELGDFRKNLVKGGGLDNYNLNTVTKRMEILQAGMSSGLNAGQMQSDVKSEAFKNPVEPERFSAVAKYMQVTAEMAELMGKDMKDAAAEVANMHEELNMSFNSVETFFMNITRQATAAGVSNEKFIKLTRSLANEQVNYGTQLKATGQILELLGTTGAYTSETLKKGFEAMMPKQDQTIEQKTVAMQGIMGDKKALEAEKSDLARVEKELEEAKARASAAPEGSTARKDAEKDIAAKREVIGGKQNLIYHMEKEDAHGSGAAQQYMSTTGQMRLALSSKALHMGGAENALALMKRGASVEDVNKAMASMNKDVAKKLQDAFGTQDISKLPQALSSMMEGGQKKVSDAIFDANGNQKALSEEDRATMEKELAKLGIKLDPKDTKETFQKKMDQFAGGGKGVVTTKALDMVDAANRISGATEDANDMKDNAMQSADKGMEESDKLLKYIKDDIEIGNDFLDALVVSTSGASDALKKIQEKRVSDTANAKLEGVQKEKRELLAAQDPSKDPAYMKAKTESEDAYNKVTSADSNLKDAEKAMADYTKKLATTRQSDPTKEAELFANVVKAKNAKEEADKNWQAKSGAFKQAEEPARQNALKSEIATLTKQLGETTDVGKKKEIQDQLNIKKAEQKKLDKNADEERLAKLQTELLAPRKDGKDKDSQINNPLDIYEHKHNIEGVLNRDHETDLKGDEVYQNFDDDQHKFTQAKEDTVLSKAATFDQTQKDALADEMKLLCKEMKEHGESYKMMQETIAKLSGGSTITNNNYGGNANYVEPAGSIAADNHALMH